MENGDAELIGWLMRKRHGSPFEHTYFKFHVEAPIFVFREWHRHRAGHSYNEQSGRYVELSGDFYYPECARVQQGKPGAYTFEEQPKDSEMSLFLGDRLEEAYEAAWVAYRALLEAGIAKEQARLSLPVSIYSQMIWSCNSRSLMHFLGLRNAPEAMAEIRELAASAELEFTRVMPVTATAFVMNGRIAP